jgi:hypothetical protein
VDHFKVSKINTARRYLRAQGLPRYRREPRASKLDSYEQYIVTTQQRLETFVARCSFSVVSAIEVCRVEVSRRGARAAIITRVQNRWSPRRMLKWARPPRHRHTRTAQVALSRKSVYSFSQPSVSRAMLGG